MNNNRQMEDRRNAKQSICRVNYFFSCCCFAAAMLPLKEMKSRGEGWPWRHGRPSWGSALLGAIGTAHVLVVSSWKPLVNVKPRLRGQSLQSDSSATLLAARVSSVTMKKFWALIHGGESHIHEHFNKCHVAKMYNDCWRCKTEIQLGQEIPIVF